MRSCGMFWRCSVFATPLGITARGLPSRRPPHWAAASWSTGVPGSATALPGAGVHPADVLPIAHQDDHQWRNSCDDPRGGRLGSFAVFRPDRSLRLAPAQSFVLSALVGPRGRCSGFGAGVSMTESRLWAPSSSADGTLSWRSFGPQPTKAGHDGGCVDRSGARVSRCAPIDLNHAAKCPDVELSQAACGGGVGVKVRLSRAGEPTSRWCGVVRGR